MNLLVVRLVVTRVVVLAGSHLMVDPVETLGDRDDDGRHGQRIQKG